MNEEDEIWHVIIMILYSKIPIAYTDIDHFKTESLNFPKIDKDTWTNIKM